MHHKVAVYPYQVSFHVGLNIHRGTSITKYSVEVSKSIKGAFFSPFARAYIPELDAHGISCNDFVAYIDGLNEAFVAHPVFQGLGIVGGVLQMAYGVQPAQYAGMGLQVAAGLASAATSYARTRAYIKATNKDLFHPAGLHVNVLTTKKMLAKVGYPEEKMQLPPLNTSDDLIIQPGMKRKEAAKAAAEQASEQNDPRMRRLEALKGYVTPFNLNVPAQVVPDNFFRKMGATQAAKMEKKQDRKSMKRQTKHYKGEARLEKLESRKDSRQTRLESELAVLDAEFDKQLSMTDDPVQQEKLRANHENDRSKRVRKLEKRLAKSERKIEKRSRKHEKKTSKLDKKEEKIAHKIRWLVITRWEKEIDSDAGSLESSDSE